MPVINDTLETVLRLVGAQQYIVGLQQIARAHQQVAAAQTAQARAAAQLQNALLGGRTISPGTLNLAQGGGGQNALSSASGMVAGGVGRMALAAVTEELSLFSEFVRSGVRDLADYERELIRVRFFQRELGRSTPTRAIADFGEQLSTSLGISQNEILRTMDYLGRYGVAGRQAERDTQSLARASQATGVGMVELAQGIEMARRGRAKELFRELGIPIKGVADQLYSFDQLLKLVELHTRGMAIPFNSLPGALDRVGTAFEAVQKNFTKLIEPAAVAGLMSLYVILRLIGEGLKAVQQHNWGFFTRGTPNRLEHALGGGGTGQSATEQYLRKIEYNTGPQGALGRATRGGGSFAEPGGGLRIREFNQMMRHQG